MPSAALGSKSSPGRGCRLTRESTPRYPVDVPPDARQLWEAVLEAERIPFASGSARVTIRPIGATGDVRFAWKARDRALLQRAVRVRIEDGPRAGSSALIFQGAAGGNRRHRGFLHMPPSTRPYAFDEQDGSVLPPPLCWGDLFLLPHPDDYTPSMPAGGVRDIGGIACTPLELARVGTASPERILWMAERDLEGARQWVEVQIDEYWHGANAVTRTIEDIEWRFVAPDMRLAVRWTARDGSGNGAACTIALVDVDLNPPSDAIFEQRSLPDRF